jgi:hypothetical protein
MNDEEFEREAYERRETPERQRNRVWSGDREYRTCKRGETIGIDLSLYYVGEISAIELVWVLENAQDRIEMWYYAQELTGQHGTNVNIGFGGTIAEYVVPGLYNCEAIRVHCGDARRPPTSFEVPKVGLLVTEETVETPRLRRFEFE